MNNIISQIIPPTPTPTQQAPSYSALVFNFVMVSVLEYKTKDC